MTVKNVAVCLLAVLLCGCSSGINPQQFAGPDTHYQKFTLCHGYGCSQRMDVGLYQYEWNEVLAAFKPAANSAEEERKQIAKGAAIFEKFANKASGLPADHAEASHLPEDDGQMDCIDETVNISQYLDFIEAEGVLSFHAAGEPIHRGYFIDGKWPHNTATITEKVNGQIYAVDSFYRSTGEEPYIIERDVWLANWSPSRQP